MIAVFASASAWADVQAAVGRGRCLLAREQGELLRLAGDADALVLEAPDILSVLGVLQEIKRENPLLPVILITEQDSANLQRLGSVAVEAVLFRHQIAARLPAALRRSAGTAFGLRALGEDCMRNEAIPGPLSQLLGCALTAVPPPRTVHHLARLLNSDPSTIRRHWRSGINSHGIRRLKDLLDWLGLLHAISLKRPGLSWRSIARGMGTHERTLRRLAVRLTGDTLGSVGSADAQRLLERFTESLRKSFYAKLS